MQLPCPHCQHVLEYLGERPHFCGYCGQRLPRPEVTPLLHEAQTTTPHPAPARPTAVPDVIGGYRLLRQMGEGGMGAVYEAEDVASGRRVAVKLIAPDAVASRDAIERFRQEGRLASAINHPRCVFVLAADEEGGWPYIVMELMPGLNLEDVVKRDGPLPPRLAIARILDVIDGLQEVHKHGIVHRDVKPSNCFLEPNGRVKIGDFGLSKSLTGDVHLTQPGSFLGTPMFAAPEQVRRESVDQQSDVYAVAATLYYLLTGRAPFQTNDLMATLARIAADPAPSMRKLRPDLDPGLDQVVLTGLERDRSRRWRDLGEFKEALLQFQPGRASRSILGVRFLAFLIDWLLLSIAGTILMLLFAPSRGDAPTTILFDDFRQVSVIEWVYWGIWVAYFGFLEGLWGASLGKALLGLRVRAARGTLPAKPRRVLLRTFLFCVLLDLHDFFHLFFQVVLWSRELTAEEFIANHPWLFWVPMLLYYPMFALGIALILLPMRARNGYRGLHEFLSGTRVVSLPVRQPLRALPRHALQPARVRPNGCPERLGAFVVHGALRWEEQAKVVAAQDSVLGREVWLWLRPASEAPLPESRRQLGRRCRLRWVACGKHAELQWDAFLAPAGAPLPDLVRAGGRLSWHEVRPILEQLAGEFSEARKEGTMPTAPKLEQVWVQPGGVVQFLDLPVSTTTAEEEGSAAGAEQCALSFLGRVAILALEGRERRKSAGGPVAAPVPLHASRLLAWLVAAPDRSGSTCAEFQAALAPTRDWPTEVSRRRRAAQVAVQAGIALLALGMVFFLGAFISSFPFLRQWDGQSAEELWRVRLLRGALRDFSCSTFPPSFAGCLGACAQLDADLALLDEFARHQKQEQARLEASLKSAPWSIRFLVQLGESNAAWSPQREDSVSYLSSDTLRVVVTVFVRRSDEAQRSAREGPTRVETRWLLLLPLFWPAVWVLAALIWREGLAYHLTGVCAVGSNGRRASRLRCAWRAFVVWAPVAGLLVLSAWLELRYWAVWKPHAAAGWLLALSTAVWYLAVGLLPIYAGVALWSPQRGPQDRLAGTWVVPR
jgi:hypothetical protein